MSPTSRPCGGRSRRRGPDEGGNRRRIDHHGGRGLAADPHALTCPARRSCARRTRSCGRRIARRASAEAALATARDGLEAQVAARTNELAQANARLEAEVAERFARSNRARRRGATRHARPSLARGRGEWVLARVCRQGAAWATAGRPLKIAVNVSAAQLRHAGLVAMVRRTLDDAGLPANLLELELTESPCSWMAPRTRSRKHCVSSRPWV